MKWYTITTYVDKETGEVLTKSQTEREYYNVKETETKTEYNGNTAIKKITKICEKSRQTKFEF